MGTHDRHTADIHLTAKTPLRLGIEHGQRVWPDATGDLMRVRATDLRHLARRVAAVRAEHPGRDVVADIHVVIAADARSARAALAASGEPPAADALLYVGTATGLAGLIADLHALGLIDGAILIPLLGQEMVDRIYNEVLPQLKTFLPAHCGDQSRPA